MDSAAKLDALKRRLRASDLPIVEYEAAYGGVFDGRPMMRELEHFGEAVFRSLLGHVTALAHRNSAQKAAVGEEGRARAIEVLAEQVRFVESESAKFEGRAQVVRDLLTALQRLSPGKAHLMVGEPGGGKTAVMVRTRKQLGDDAR